MSVSNRPVQFLSRITGIGWHKLRHWPPGTNKLPFVPPFFCLSCQVPIPHRILDASYSVSA